MTDIHDTADLVSKALRRAWQLGQTYWQQADSEYQSHWKKADATQNEFDRLEEDTRAAILTANSIAQPAPFIPEGWKLVPIEPTREMIQKACSDHGYPCGDRSVYARGYRTMLAAAPEARP